MLTTRLFALSTTAVVASLTTVGCLSAGNFEGEVDGNNVPMMLSAFYGSASNDNGTVTQVIAYSYAVDCDKVGTWMEEKSDIEDDYFESDRENDDLDEAVEGLEKADEEFGLPDEGWTISVFFGGEDDLEETDFDAFGENDMFVGVGIAHQREQPDYEEILEDGEDNSSDSYGAIDGKIEILDFVEDESFRITGEDIVLAEEEDIAEDGDDASDVGEGRFSLTVRHCDAFSDMLDELLDPETDTPNGPNGPDGQFCEVTEECPNIACICDDGSTLGMPVNTRRCINQSCEQPAAACPTSCDTFGFTWTGQAEVTDPVEPPVDDGAEEGSCSGFLGADDGCDCGCGVLDTDCASMTDTCSFNNCVSGTPDPNDNRQCIPA